MGRGQRLFLCALFWTMTTAIIPSVVANCCPSMRRTQVMNTTLGPVQGFCDLVLNRTVYSFLGIPFAQPPVGRLRFRKPVPIRPWKDVFAAMKMPPRCKQSSVLSQEDCLYLNVWTPTLDMSEKLDVMVYFHGGVFVFERPLIQRDLRYMAALGNVVLVKMNYRLGAFGFLYGNHDGAPGNMGLYDQYLALLFVRDNIHLFGGDPEKITAFGNSAGAMSIGLMTTSPLAGPLIKRAILQSGSPCVSIIARENRSVELADKLAYRTGCAFEGMSIATHSRQIVSCLRRVEADKIVAVQTELFANIEVYLPVFGDAMLPVHILTALKRGLFNKDLKLLIGVTPDEGTSILNTASPQFFQRDSHRKVSKSDLLSTCNRTFLYTFSKAKLRRIYWNYMGLLGHTSYLTQRTALSNCIADYFMLCPAHHFAQELNRKGVETYFYLFDYRTKNSITPPWMGVVHTAEVYYLFGEPFSTNWYTDEEREFSKTIVDIWSTFARTGQPPKHLRWPKYLWSRPRYLRLNPRKFAPGRGPREQWCRLWNDPIK
ncbi:acetylcholinesterase-like isoform X1 [Amblyomma americanum]